MIATLEGRVGLKDSERIVVLVGGIGLEVLAPFSTLEKVTGEQVFLHTRLVVREDSLTLYGFASEAERDLFDSFIKISGIGPKLAITILSSLSVDNVRGAVTNDRPEVLSRVPGIGKKTAEKIVLELRDKLATVLDTAPFDGASTINADVIDALTALGYSVIEAQTAVQALPLDAPEDEESRVFLALQYLGV
ncbi:MAG: Holliday junction branch migration protein RuvA [Chloroflexi bacterium]|nr:Holliday junction branch migration protein RuvA [Chloroflexota bacterium]